MMEKTKIDIWGKSKNTFKDEGGNVVKESVVTLAKHIQDVLCVFLHLYNFLKENRTNNNCFYNPITDELKQLIEIVIQYHDIGKVLPYFQIKTINNQSYQPFDVYANIPHSLLSSLMIDVNELKNEVAKIVEKKELVEKYTKYVVSAVAYHHWRDSFYDIIEGYSDVFPKLKQLVSNKEKWNQVETNIQQVYADLKFTDKYKPYINLQWLEGLNSGIRYADYIIPPYLLYRMPKRIQMNDDSLKDWVLMSGFTMLSDHFASYIEGQGEEDVSFEKIEIKGTDFNAIKDKIAEDLEVKIGAGYNSENIWQFKFVGQYKDDNAILLAPTGMGKTEFAYLWSNGEKFFYTLPLRAAVNQIYSRTKSVLGKDKAGLLHSDADVFIYGDGEETESMRVYEMAKQLSSPAIVSTGDQFFPYALRPPSYERIFAKFSYSRLIIDEVQAYDPKAAAIVVKYIEDVVQMGGKFLLMTATLPGFIEREICERTGFTNSNRLNLFEQDSRLNEFSKHKIELLIDAYKEQSSYSKEILQKIIGKAKENGGSRVLVVLNTVKQAQAVYNDLVNLAKHEIEIKLFHSRYTQQHRKTTEDNLISFIGNNNASRKDKKPKVLVATQVVEASLDLDADCLFTELSPWDSLIQRMGRVLRELRVDTTDEIRVELLKRRYNSKEIPTNVFIMIYAGKRNNKPIYESSQGYVYNQELLRTTLKLIKDLKTSVDDLKKWNNGNRHEFKGLNKIKAFTLAEKEKSELIEKLFEGLPEDSKYLKSYNDMLHLLDSGFMSDRKTEAQRTFREINDVSVIAEDKKDELFNELKTFEYSKKYGYTDFKSKIILKYVVNVQRNKVQKYLYDESNLVTSRLKAEEIAIDKKALTKLQNWLWGIYFVRLNYSETNGLVGVTELGGEVW